MEHHCFGGQTVVSSRLSLDTMGQVEDCDRDLGVTGVCALALLGSGVWGAFPVPHIAVCMQAALLPSECHALSIQGRTFAPTALASSALH